MKIQFPLKKQFQKDYPYFAWGYDYPLKQWYFQLFWLNEKANETGEECDERYDKTFGCTEDELAAAIHKFVDTTDEGVMLCLEILDEGEDPAPALSKAIEDGLKTNCVVEFDSIAFRGERGLPCKIQ